MNIPTHQTRWREPGDEGITDGRKHRKRSLPVKKTLDLRHLETKKASGSKVMLSKAMTLMAKLKDSKLKAKQHLYIATSL